MKAIQITQQIKDLNAKLYPNLVVDSIRQFSNIPKSFYSPNYNLGQRTDGYNTLSNTIHESDGFYDVITPVYDEATQKLGTIFFDVDKFTYNVLEKTQEEIDEYNQIQLDQDSYQSKIDRRSNDGKRGIQRLFARINRDVDNGLSVQNAATAANLIFDATNIMAYGQFELAKNRLNQIDTTGLNQPVIDLINLAKDKIQQYLDNEL